MRTISKILFIGGAAAVAGTFGLTALADMPMRGGAHGVGVSMGMGTGHGMMGQMGAGMGHGAQHGGAGHALADPARIETLKTELGITPAQEPGWHRYVETVREASVAMRSMHEGIDHDAIRRMKPQDRFAFANAMHEQRRQQADAVRSAADALLATLDEGQKTKAGEILPGMVEDGPGSMHRADKHHMPHGHHNR